MGSNLAVLNSKAELREFPQLLKSAGASKVWWIGLYRDPKNLRQWLWVDGSTAYFTSWDTGEPDRLLANENCVEFRMMSEKWNDNPCSYSRPYTCEINSKYSILHEHIYKQTIDGLTELVLRQERK